MFVLSVAGISWDDSYNHFLGKSSLNMLLKISLGVLGTDIYEKEIKREASPAIYIVSIIIMS